MGAEPTGQEPPEEHGRGAGDDEIWYTAQQGDDTINGGTGTDTVYHQGINSSFGDIIPLVLANALSVDIGIINGNGNVINVVSNTNANRKIFIHHHNEHYSGISPVVPAEPSLHPGKKPDIKCVSPKIKVTPSGSRIQYSVSDLRKLSATCHPIKRSVRKQLFKYKLWKAHPKNKTTKDNGTEASNSVSPIPVRVTECRPKKMQERGSCPTNFAFMDRSPRWNNKCLLLNARSVRNKTLTIREHIIDNDVSLSMLTETWLRSSEDEVVKEMTPDGFTYFGQTRQTGRGGGVAIICRDTFNARETVQTQYNTFEHLSASVTCHSSSAQCHIAVIYRPPSSPIP